MAKKQNEPPPVTEGSIDAIHTGINKLWQNHSEEIEKVITESKDRAVTVNFKVDINKSNPAESVDIGIRFSTAVTDKVKYTLDDPNQGSFREIIGEVEGEPVVEAEPTDE